jgi:hypothetical protein
MPDAARAIAQSLEVAAAEVYDFGRGMENLPHWASGLATGIHRQDGEWFTDSHLLALKTLLERRRAGP